MCTCICFVVLREVGELRAVLQRPVCADAVDNVVPYHTRFRKPVHEHFLCGTVGDSMQKPATLLRLKESEKEKQAEGSSRREDKR